MISHTLTALSGYIAGRYLNESSKLELESIDSLREELKYNKLESVDSVKGHLLSQINSSIASGEAIGSLRTFLGRIEYDYNSIIEFKNLLRSKGVEVDTSSWNLLDHFAEIESQMTRLTNQLESYTLQNVLMTQDTSLTYNEGASCFLQSDESNKIYYKENITFNEVISQPFLDLNQFSSISYDESDSVSYSVDKTNVGKIISINNGGDILLCRVVTAYSLMNWDFFDCVAQEKQVLVATNAPNAFGFADMFFQSDDGVANAPRQHVETLAFTGDYSGLDEVPSTLLGTIKNVSYLNAPASNSNVIRVARKYEKGQGSKYQVYFERNENISGLHVYHNGISKNALKAVACRGYSKLSYLGD